MRPYYERGGIVLYHADCREVLPFVSADLLLTDPPYGISADRRQAQRANKQHGKALAPSRDYGRSDWDGQPPPSWLVGQMLDRVRWAIAWGGNYFALPPARCWLVWDKDNGSNGYADCELAWTNLDKAVRRTKHRWMGMLQEPGAPRETRVHPTQKPLPVMRWALLQAPDDCATVLDPFAGSGTTLLAALECGRSAIGVEADERYCDEAAKRLEAAANAPKDVALPLEASA